LEDTILVDLHPHKHILERLSESGKSKLTEEFGTNPHYTTNAGIKGGDSHVLATATKKDGEDKKEGDEYHQTGAPRREIAIADRILKAAQNMAKTPDVDEIIRLATELKKMHGV
jgi:hypothetical protein